MRKKESHIGINKLFLVVIESILDEKKIGFVKRHFNAFLYKHRPQISATSKRRKINKVSCRKFSNFFS